MWFLFGKVPSSSGYLSALFYCGTPWERIIVILNKHSNCINIWIETKLLPDPWAGTCILFYF